MGVFDMTYLGITKYIIFFCSGFIYIPGGRDIIAPGKPLMPKDEQAFKYMSGNAPGFAVMWQVWGLLWYAFSTMKIMAVVMELPEFLAMAAFFEIIITVVFGLKIPHAEQYGADVKPFLGVFGLECAALLVSVLL